MFTRQAPIISDSLLQGGLAAPQAFAVTNALGQCRAPLVHRAPIEVDYSSPEMRLILPEQVPVRFPDIVLNPPETSPPRPPELPPPEEVPPQEPNPLPPQQNPVGPIRPPMGAPGGGTVTSGLPRWLKPWLKEAMDYYKKLREDVDNLVVEAGEYIDLDEANDTKRYKLKTETDKDGYVCTFGTDEIVGREFKYLLEDNSTEILEIVRDENAGVPENQITVITGVSLTASGLEFKERKISVIEAGAEGAGPTISVVECDAAAGGNP